MSEEHDDGELRAAMGRELEALLRRADGCDQCAESATVAHRAFLEQIDMCDATADATYAIALLVPPEDHGRLNEAVEIMLVAARASQERAMLGGYAQHNVRQHHPDEVEVPV